MPGLHRSSAPSIRRVVTVAAARWALAATVLAAWPLTAIAQQSDDAASPSASSGRHAGHHRKSTSGDQGNEGNLPAATRRARADEQRLLGGPGSTFNPYESDGSSPKSQEDALTNEQRMKVINPSGFYRSSGPGGPGGSRATANAGGAGRAKRQVGGPSLTTGISTGGTQGSAQGMPDPYGDSAGTPSSTLYRDPYKTQSTSAGQPYRSPW